MGIRTPDLLNAIEALYQLSYDPLIKNFPVHGNLFHNATTKSIKK